MSTTGYLANIDQDGTVPKTRISSVAEAVAIVRRCINDNIPRTRQLVRMKAFVDGESPFSGQKLRQNGQGYRSNVNPMDAAAHLQAAMVPYYDLFATQQNFVDCETDEGGANDATIYSRIITEEVDTYLRQDTEFEANMRSMIYWRVGYGTGTLLWKDPFTPAFQTIPPYKFFVPGRSLACVKGLSLACIELEYDVTELYRKIADEKMAKAAGWFPEEVKRAIAAAGNQNVQNASDFGTFQQMIKNNQFVFTEQYRMVKVGRLFWKEFDGTVSECMVRLDTEVNGMPTDQNEHDPRHFLYHRQGKYKSMDEVCSAFFQESAEGFWHGATGQMHMIYNVLTLKARQFNAVQDGAFLRAGPMVRAMTANATDKAALTQVGTCTVISNQFEVQPANILGDLESVMAVSGYNDNTVFQNTGVYRAVVQREKGNPETATEAQFRYEQAAALSTAAVNRFLSELDIFYKELVKRLLTNPIDKMMDDHRDAVRELRKKIVERGVPKEVLSKVTRVYAPRGIGTVARNLKTITLQDYQVMLGSMAGRGAKNFQEDYFAARYGYRMARRWIGEEGDKPGDQDQMWEAQQESTLLKDGNQPYITDTQDDFIHASEHLRETTAAINSIPNGADKVAVLAFAQASGQHIADHLGRIQNNRLRMQEVNALMNGLKQLGQVTDQLQEMVQEEQQAQATQGHAQAIQDGTDPDYQLKAAKMQADMQLKKEKQDRQLSLKEEQAKKNFALQDAKTAHEIITRNVQAQAAAGERAAAKATA